MAAVGISSLRANGAADRRHDVLARVPSAEVVLVALAVVAV
jgi:hypothetical protein